MSCQVWKAPGWDALPAEVLKNDTAIIFLHHMFNVCFNHGIVPESWASSIVNPIPKNLTTDPLNYRGITLVSSAYKIYAGILNRRLTIWTELNGKVGDEQNGFRAGRSCVDHLLSTLSEIIDTRKQQGISTYVAFINFSKAYNRINRNLMWSKLERMCVAPKFTCALKSLYKDVKCS